LHEDDDRRELNPEHADKIARMLAWLRLQMAYDLAQARRHEADINVEPVARSRR
jgi:plasmid maintenance system antidote protein VapI